MLPIAAMLLLAACARTDVSQANKLSDVFATPDWANFSNSKPTALRAITPEDLVSAEGQCASQAVATAPAATDGAAPNAPDVTGDPLAGQGALPQLQGGVALAMTECQVVQRTGYPDRVDIAAEGTERVATMTVTRGSWPGLYRFRSGRLVSIERINVPPPPKPVKGQKRASQKQAVPMRGSQQ